MTIRFKILALAFAILIIFGVVVGISTWLQHQFMNQIVAITRYHIPLRTLIADFDVRTDRYELIILRMLRQSALSQNDLETTRSQAQQEAKRIADDLAQFNALVDKALADPTVARKSQSTFSELKGATPFIERQLHPFLKLGEQVLQAAADGHLDEARNQSLEFRKTEAAFGPDTSALREKLGELTTAVGSAALSRQSIIQGLDLFLFALAGCLGIGAGIFVSAHIVRTLRRLAEGTAAVQAGHFAITVPVDTNDEVGQLALAFNRMVEEIRIREKIKDAFGKFVDPRIVANLIATASGEFDRAERQVVTVFFSDIAGFTSMSEQLTASAIVNMLNHYFTAVTAPIRDNHGIVDKYIGDGLMAFWAAPFSPGDTHASSACFSALQQQAALDGLNKELPNLVGLRRGAPTLRVRMGIATGEVIVGTIGSSVSKSFTVIGDTVNVASRLVGASEVYGTPIIISEDTLRLGRQEVEVRELDLITVVGRSEPIRIYELLGRTGELVTGTLELAHEFEDGLKAYREREWAAAEERFQRCLEMRPADRPSAIYMERIAEMRRSPPPANWNGVWHLSKK
ncbi:MAG TPA: adenylate/guanylate cyclase domain-containing protein [Pseudolabrys sp.]|nr:adenylate/guanylate cyclase domain-containing protein [Pseudolabrys sp.]